MYYLEHTILFYYPQKSKHVVSSVLLIKKRRYGHGRNGDCSVEIRSRVSILHHDPDGSDNLFFFFPDQLPVCPSCCGSECWDTASSEDKDQAVSQQHHSHLPCLFLPVPCLLISTHPAGAGLQLYYRYCFISGKYSSEYEWKHILNTWPVFLFPRNI